MLHEATNATRNIMSTSRVRYVDVIADVIVFTHLATPRKVMDTDSDRTLMSSSSGTANRWDRDSLAVRVL